MIFSMYVAGDLACFTRPEFKLERCSYDVPTRTAVRGVFSSVFWKPGIDWNPTKVEVLKPIQHISLKRIERDNQTSFPRQTLALKNVAYIFHAEMKVVLAEDVIKSMEQFKRRLTRGACFRQPFLGMKEFAVREFGSVPEGISPIPETRPLGAMLMSMNYPGVEHEWKGGNWVKKNSKTKVGEPTFANLIMRNGVVEYNHASV